MGKKVLIVGGVAGGATAAARMRRLDESAEITLFERGEFISFANCGLPYFIGDVITDEDKLTLQTPESFNARFNVDVRVFSEVVKIDRKAKFVTVSDLANKRLYDIPYDFLVLSPGAAPILPSIEGADSDAVFTLRTIPDTFKIKNYINSYQPKHAVVVGAGYIGIEMAENLHSAGLSVSIVEMTDHVIQSIDADMAGEVHKHILSMGVGLYLNLGVVSIRPGDSVSPVVLSDFAPASSAPPSKSSLHDGAELSGIASSARYKVQLSNGEVLPADMVVMAVGVRPESSLARDAGLATGTRGCIVVDEHMRTADPFIYAVGDAVEVTDFASGRKMFVPLASPANRQGRIAADNIHGIKSSYRGVQGTAILKAFDMTVAVTGNSEKSLVENKIPYLKSYTFSSSHAGYYPGATFMSIKLMFAPTTGKILGAAITGHDGVDKRMDVLATALRAGMTVYDLTELELAYAPPFGSAKDPVNMAGYTASNILEGSWKPFYWHDIPSIDLTRAILLDVRTEEEFLNGTLSGAVNIPLDELRKRDGELDKAKPIYLFCQIGLRGYIASRILSSKGFNVYNLSGGYRFATMATSSVPPTPPVKLSLDNSSDQDTLSMQLSERSQASSATTSIGLSPDIAAKSLFPDIKVDACGLQCPGPILKVFSEIQKIEPGQILEISATDPAFASDIVAWCRRTGHELLESKTEKGSIRVLIKKGEPQDSAKEASISKTDKNIIVFSGDLDKAIAAMIIANGAAAMGRKVSMFFTFWGLNILRKAQRVRVRKNVIEKMFGFMMPRGAKRLTLSKMNMCGAGAAMIRGIMKKKNVASLSELMTVAQQNGVTFIACTMSMDLMGIKMEELVEGTEKGGVAAMLATAEESDMSLFI